MVNQKKQNLNQHRLVVLSLRRQKAEPSPYVRMTKPRESASIAKARQVCFEFNFYVRCLRRRNRETRKQAINGSVAVGSGTAFVRKVKKFVTGPLFANSETKLKS